MKRDLVGGIGFGLLGIAARGETACSMANYYQCSGAEMRQLQKKQFDGRKRSTSYLQSDSYTGTSNYWRDRQYNDRLAAIEIAKHQRRAYRQPRVVYVSPAWRNRYPDPKPDPPAPNPVPVERDRRVPSAIR